MIMYEPKEKLSAFTYLHLFLSQHPDILFLPLSQTLNLSYNQLSVIPSDLGWLPLQQLQLQGNTGLRMPAVILDRGFR